MEHGRATLIGLDWGTSSLRAYLLDERGRVLDRRALPWGVLAAPGADFAAAYHAVVHDWRERFGDLPAIAAGMIGSSEGWLPAPYCTLPAGPRDFAGALRALDTGSDGVVRIVPGVEQRGPRPDVMRGEETQVTGALTLWPELADDAALVLPGTHSKWVRVRDGRIAAFATYMTGELYALLRDHSILGRPARRAAEGARSVAWESFDRGVDLARGNPSGIAPLLFLTRSLVLQNEIRAEESLDFLSGLLIGDELRAAPAAAAPVLAFIGEASICERYLRAAKRAGMTGAIVDGAGPAGLWEIARLAGFVEGPGSDV